MPIDISTHSNIHILDKHRTNQVPVTEVDNNNGFVFVVPTDPNIPTDPNLRPNPTVLDL